jgi:hypothetical protein
MASLHRFVIVVSAITVTGMLARTAVSQTFTNRSDEWVDGLYVFPLPESAAVDHLMILSLLINKLKIPFTTKS